MVLAGQPRFRIKHDAGSMDSQSNYSPNRNPLRSKTLVAYLALGVLFRVVFMAPVMLLILSILTYPSISVLGVVKVVLPLQAIFNILVPLYMIPSGYLIAKIINRNLRIGNEIG